MSTLTNRSTPWLISLILALLLTIALIMLRNKPVPEAMIIEKTDTIPGDRVPYPVYLPQPYPVTSYRDTGQPHWMIRPVDTAAILATFDRTNVYCDTLKNDSSALVIIKDTVRWNALQRRALVFQNRRPTFIQNTIRAPTQPSMCFLAGIGVGRNKKEFALAPTIGLLHKQRTIYTVSYDLVQKDVYISALWTLGKRIKIP